MEKENERLARQMKEILRKKAEENKALLNLIKALQPDKEKQEGWNLKTDH